VLFGTKNFIFYKIIPFHAFKKKIRKFRKISLFIFSPDESEKPFEIEMHFFLRKNSDQRKLVFYLGKKQLREKA